ncbi:hypothetical protein CAPTEDRAFT_163108 [Capitella teleta]|uniref:Neurotransmitter-gated ion-channel ligand-binding domain-containing protein n=1 Tax=Capitella teleta TaxID=283909 RepID=R7TIR4_CAPTE|nr:hypothetical protein CAPTEDRAFT_163108 [Capitella teleta]|eukprot:ELT93352.1 hypothetical protein CAPTEDRAFT_163108 [Capitella teleta]
MDYSLSVFLRQYWHDPRLGYQHLSNETVLSLDYRMLERLWVPDLFFSNEKRGHFHNVMTPNTYLRIYPQGHVHYSSRVSLVLSCPMLLQKFPLDAQVCKMNIETYAYELEQLKFKWADERPLEFNTDMELPQFELVGHAIAETVKEYSTGNFSALRVNFILKRDIGFYIIQIYIPSILIVILSWVSFWLSLDAVPARISLGVLTVLTMTTQTSGMTSRLPRVSYIKAIDVWLSTCLVFVFSALLEFAVVNVMCRNQPTGRQRKKKRNRKQKNEMRMTEVHCDAQPSHKALLGAKDSNSDGNNHTTVCLESHGPVSHGFQMRHKAQMVDNFSRTIFPVCFVLFNLVYWLVYIFYAGTHPESQ